jgi:hypothetical protein
MQSRKLQEALKNLKAAIQEVERIVEELHSEKDPLAVHIFVSRRNYRNVHDTKSGKRRDTAARLSWQSACNLGFRGTLGEWERLMVPQGCSGTSSDEPEKSFDICLDHILPT